MTTLIDLATTTAACEIQRSVLAVNGGDAESFLQGQLSQDVASLRQGQSAWSLVLQPQGRIDAFVRVSRLGSEQFVLDTDGLVEPLVDRLERFKLRTQVVIEPLQWLGIAVRGPEASRYLGQDAVQAAVSSEVPIGGVDILGVDLVWPSDLPCMDAATFEVHRIRSGWPRTGSEINQRTIPAEAEVVSFTVSFTKGCFVGQELVARMDSRGNTAPRYLRVLTFAEQADIACGEPIIASSELGVDEQDEVGTITSVAWDAINGETVALGYVKRNVAMPAVLYVAGCVAQVSAVPRDGSFVGSVHQDLRHH
ncbi:MAG: folate-binding protein YgfZ [Acidimicrobiia bacterium]|nr:folate-binding protein YgfZ [Acidimicrobiia bacterium]MYC57194.1 folate-binding protein YgfZ [Acidimicrobiia bacterium]MYG93879.1 folate-binding protein YgfZ [Acidimicrobiia bacterium]MYI29882.1 folate-binding protein YgfZ [Acidimicrobiia bacterium]